MAFPPQRALERLLAAQAAGRLAHAYLLCGPRGSGKREVIERLAARILETDDALRHPDFHSAEPESKSRRILIEQIRRLEQALRTKPSAGSRKVAVIHEADRLQPQAANAFLKTLEEPPAGSHVFLASDSPDALLETITSRCIVVQIQAGAAQPPSESGEELLAALERLLAAPGSPTRAAFALARTFLDVLGRERERIRDEAAELLKAEQTHYKRSTDGAWLDEREEQLKAISEAGALRVRAELIQTLAGWFADLLRVQHGAPAAFDRPALRAQAATSPKSTLLRIQAIEETTTALDRNIQEALAVEAGFLKLFTIPA
ncbi:MAG: AAA family ATPase [Terrimicrobiaceae bacterium]|nr:AAA family ATPase [Terrimicrobiaceae bacterium]